MITFSLPFIRRCIFAGAITLAALAGAQEITPTTGIVFAVVGKITPRAAKEISSSWWSIGGETLDREFAVYDHYKQYLGPLGAKGIRLQAGWAKCEKRPGVYDFAWLDTMVDDARAQGVQPWLELSYGNPLYAGGGDPGLGGGFPSSPGALAAWDQWVTALVHHFKDRVHEWEIWNEPDLNNAGTAKPEAYADLHLRTAIRIRAAQPQSRIFALGLAGNIAYAETALTHLAKAGRLDLVDAVTIHGYPRNPDDTDRIDQLRAVLAKLGRSIQVRQGESGAPSQFQENFALQKITWTQTTQAKWDLRRLLAHRAKDVPMNLFTLADLHYTIASHQGGADGVVRMNYKGLLATNSDRTIAYLKPAYAGAQAVFTIFDDALARIPDFESTTTALRGLALAGYRRDRDGAQVAAYWFSDAPPDEANGVSAADLTLRRGQFTDPVLVDVRTCTVYDVPREHWTQTANGTVFRAMPIYDSPILIAERSIVRVNPAAR